MCIEDFFPNPSKLSSTMEQDHNVNFIKGSSKFQTEEDEIQFQNGGSLLGLTSKSPSKWPKSKVLLFISLVALFVVTLAMLLLLLDRRHYTTHWETSEGETYTTHGETGEGESTPSRASMTPAETTPSPFVAQTTARWETFRLPQTMKPSHYDITLQTFVEENYFSGSVVITFTCLEATNVVILHKEDLNVIENSISLTKKGSNRKLMLQSPPEYYPDYAFFILTFQNNLQENKVYTLRVAFQSEFTQHNYGLYRTEYQTRDGPRYVIASFLSPMGARKVFPCFDEPSFKANFTVKIIHPKSYTALSNMPVVKKIVNNSWTESTFQTSPLMSTYLLSFAVTKFISRAKFLKNNVELRVWCRQDQYDDLEYSLREAEKLFLSLEEYSGFSYPLPKLDLLALPELLPSGMENWGLITLREKHVLINTRRQSTIDIENSIFVIAHELSHQWYSNLVTQDFWDDLWLKECFASLLGYIAIDAVHPTWEKLVEQAFTSNILEIMKTDALDTSHPILREISKPSQVLDNFDLVSYWKSTAVVRMLLGLMGDTVFREGMERFLHEKAYQNANSEDLWNALDREVDHDKLGIHIADLMRPWLGQAGYPLVSVTAIPGESKVRVTQTAFLLDEDVRDTRTPSPYNYTWDVPLTFVTYTNRNWTSPQGHVIKRTLDYPVEIQVQNFNENDWIIVNANRTGYYRVIYDEENRNRLLAQLEEDHEVFSPATRASLIDDSFSLAMAGYLNYSDVFQFTKYMSKERHYLPWRVLLSNFKYVTQMLHTTSAYGLFQNYMLQLIGPVFDATENALNNTGNGLSEPERLLQTSIFEAACNYGYQPCIEKAKVQFSRFVDEGESLHPDFKRAILSTALSDPSATDQAFTCIKDSDSMEESFQWLVALSSSPQPWVLNSVLELSLNTSVLRKPDVVDIFKYITANPIGVFLTWNFFRDNWDILRDRYADGLFQMNQIITYVTDWFNTEFQLQELKTFVASKEGDLEGAAGLSSFMAAIDKTETNIQWMNNNYGQVKTWLERNTK